MANNWSAERDSNGASVSNNHVPLTLEQIEQLCALDTCTVANAIERFNLRLRNEGYTAPGIKCVNGSFKPIVGFAGTCRVKTSNPPMSGNYYYDRTDWWNAIETLPKPRIAVIQDVDSAPALGASVGEVHAAILKALSCVGVITDGGVRDLPAVAALNFPMFACHVSLSHAYAHVIDYGTKVTVSGLEIALGDLLMGDCHGVLSIPREIAADVASVAQEIARAERKVIDLCASPEFTIEKLRTAIETL